MTILGLAVLPLAMALVVLLLRGSPVIAAALSAATLVVVAALSMACQEGAPLIILGRSLGLSKLEGSSLALCCVLLAAVMIHESRVGREPWCYPLTLAAVGFFAAATIVRNVAIGALLLECGAILSVMLVLSSRMGAAMVASRALVLLVLTALLFLIAAWAMESRAINPGNAQLARASDVTLLVGFCLGLALVPFHVWLAPVFRYGRPLAVAMLSVVLTFTILVHLGEILLGWPGAEEFASVLFLGSGVVTALAGSVMAAPQRTVSRAFAYAALADLGLVFVGLGIGTRTSIAAAWLHIAYRSVGIVGVAMALDTLRGCLGSDQVEQMRGAWRCAPLAVLGLTIGGMSLVGLPLTAGFTTRLSLYRVLATEHSAWAIAIIASSLGPAWAFMRFVVAAISPPIPGRQREPWLPGLVTLGLSLALLVLGIYPSLLSLLPGEWLDPFFSAALTPSG